MDHRQGDEPADTMWLDLPTDRAIVLLLRHAHRPGALWDAPGEKVAVTSAGMAATRHLAASLAPRIVSLRSSPVDRCMQTASILASSGALSIEVTSDELLGRPGIFVEDADRAGRHWRERTPEDMLRHLASEEPPLEGLRNPRDAAMRLVDTLCDRTAGRPGLHVSVTHDSVLIPVIAHAVGLRPFLEHDWPVYLEGLAFWTQDGERVFRYREQLIRRSVTRRHGDAEMVTRPCVVTE